MSEIPYRKKGKRPQAHGVKKHNDKVHAEKQGMRSKALALRIRGASFATIGTQLGVSYQTAHKYVEEALAAIPRENAKKVLALELEKLDQRELQTQQRLTRAGLTDNDFAKLQQVLARISEQRARLEGLNAPVAHEVTMLDRVNKASVREMTDDELQRIASGDFEALTHRARVDGASNGAARDPQAGAASGADRDPRPPH
jgi:hypothetical protein